MTPLDALAQRAISTGLVTANLTIFTGSDPDLPSISPTGPAVMTIAQTGGTRRTRIQGLPPSAGLKYPHFQFVARHPRYPNAEALAYAVHGAMELENVLIGDVFFLWIVPMQDPFDHGKDANGRPRVAFNVETCWRR
jgi:hypothetical protein